MWFGRGEAAKVAVDRHTEHVFPFQRIPEHAETAERFFHCVRVQGKGVSCIYRISTYQDLGPARHMNSKCTCAVSQLAVCDVVEREDGVESSFSLCSASTVFAGC